MHQEKIGLALIAPAGCAPEGADIARGLAVLAARGFAVHNYYEHAARYLRFGASDAERVAQIHAAAQNPEVQVVMALRGSYGLSRILHLLDYELLANSGKIFVGYSDLTALSLALLAQTGAASYTGPMLCDDFTREDVSDFTLDNFLACLHGPQHVLKIEHAQALEGPIAEEGLLWGGNLAMINSLMGTRFMPQIQHGILFVEDVSEHPYRVERMLLQLLHAGVLQQQRALILGDFSNYRLSPYDNGYDFASMLAFLRSQLSIPVLLGLPYGHIRQRATLAIGAQAQLQADATGFSLTMRAYPCLRANTFTSTS